MFPNTENIRAHLTKAKVLGISSSHQCWNMRLELSQVLCFIQDSWSLCEKYCVLNEFILQFFCKICILEEMLPYFIKKIILHQHCYVKNNVQNSRNILNDRLTAQQKENTETLWYYLK